MDAPAVSLLAPEVERPSTRHPDPSEVQAADRVTFEPNEGAFWDALDRVSIPVSSRSGDQDNLAGSEGKMSEETPQAKELLRYHLSREKRLFDILYFKEDRWPHFEVSSPRFRRGSHKAANGDPAENGAHHFDQEVQPEAHQTTTTTAAASQEKERVLTRISEKQRACIVQLKPSLLYPSSEGEQSFKEVSLAVDGQGSCCGQNRNRKTLGNYKNTGFCQYHVFGQEGGSEEHWLRSNYLSVRGFNLARKPGDSKLRHFMCLESSEGKVFLKWCTQCHLWKNFNEFCRTLNKPGVASPHIDTFCTNCHERQVKSREKQLQKRRTERNNKNSGAAGKAFKQLQGMGGALAAGAGAGDLSEGLQGQPQQQVLQPPLVVPQAVNGQNGAHPSLNGTNGGEVAVIGNGIEGSSAIDAPKTPEIQEEHKAQNGEVRANGHASLDDSVVAVAGQVVQAAFAASPEPVVAAAEAVPKKKNKRKLVVDPEEAKRLRQLQMDLMSKIQVHDFPFWHANQDVFFEALDTVKVDKMTLREYYGSEDRLGDILYFPLGKHPHFIEENNPIPKRGNLHEVIERDRSRGKVFHPNLRISDDQKLCINFLQPVLMYPIVTVDNRNDFRYVEVKTAPCQEIRNTSVAKKILGNYKFTGFCAACVNGEGQASIQTWQETGFASIRGFNLGRKKVDHRLRHLMCLESHEGKVFLKWCTQCHTWKNFASYFTKSESGNKLTTFCSICHRRQMVSRKMQSQTRKPVKGLRKEYK